MFTCLLHFASNHSYELEVSRLMVSYGAEELTKKLDLSDQEKAVYAFQIQVKQFAAEAPANSLKWDTPQSVIALASFFLGLLTLIVFATKNLPWSP